LCWYHTHKSSYGLSNMCNWKGYKTPFRRAGHKCTWSRLPVFLVKEFSVLNLRPNVYQELFCYDKQRLGQERNLVHRSVLCSKFLSLSHRKGAAKTRGNLSPKYLKVICMYHPFFAFKAMTFTMSTQSSKYVITEQWQLAIPLPLD